MNEASNTLSKKTIYDCGCSHLKVEAGMCDIYAPDGTERPPPRLTPEEALAAAQRARKEKTLEERKVEALEAIAKSLEQISNTLGDDVDVERAGSITTNLDAIYQNLDRDR